MEIKLKNLKKFPISEKSIDEALKCIFEIFVKHTNTNLHALQRMRKHLNPDKPRYLQCYDKQPVL